MTSDNSNHPEYSGGEKAVAIQARSLPDQVTEFLFQELMNGRLKPGDRINELQLSRNLGISRNPIRESFKRIEERGFLITVPYKGTFVRNFSVDDVDDIFEFRKVVEAFALHNAVPKLTDADLDNLDNLISEMLTSAKNQDAVATAESDMLFHTYLLQIGGNKHAQKYFADLSSEVRILMLLAGATFQSRRESAADHQPIIEALKARDLERCLAAMDEHLNDAQKRLHKLLSDQS